MARDEYGHYVNKKGMEIKVSTSSSGKEKIDIYDKCAADPDHKSIHINLDSDTGKGTITDTTNGKTETTNTQCYLTTACVKHMKEEFDDDCYELTTLRWFRDNFVSKEDIELYYEVAPKVVENIDKLEDSETIYQYIYTNIVDACVKAIEHGEYEFAYNRYKSSVLALSKQFDVKEIETPCVKKIGSIYNNQAYTF